MDRPRVLAGGTHPTALCRSDGDWEFGFPAEHVVHLRHLIHDLFHRDAHEIREHELDDRPRPRRRRAGRRAHEAGLADRRIPDPLLAELFVEAARYLEDAAEEPDVFAHQVDVLVALEFFAEA